MTFIGMDGSVEFRFFRPGANDVRIAGDFDGWSGQTEMQHLGQGWWSATAALESGEYRFRYLADGQWYTDYAANGVEYNKAGLNSILVVPNLRSPKIRIHPRPDKACA